MSTIAIIDYGMGNLHSMAKAVEHVSDAHRVIVTADAAKIRAADRVVFPGQGAARDCMHEIHAAELVEVLHETARSKPFFGVCMGLQVLLERSDEGGGTDCLGIFPGGVHFFGPPLAERREPERLKIPHMGWNRVSQRDAHPLWRDIPQGSRFYFVHSYYADPESEELVAGTTDYGIEFPCVLAHENIFAVQFHPEKSHTAGLQLLRNFTQWDGA